MSTTALTADAGAVPGWRVLTTRILAALLALVVGLVFFSLPLLVLSWFTSGEEEIHAVHGIGWGVLAGLLLAGGFLAHAISPRRVGGLQLAAGAVVALVLATAFGDAADLPQVAPFVLGLALLVFLSPARRAFADLAPRNKVLLAITLVAAVPLLFYAWDQAALARTAAPTDPHVAEDNHYGSMFRHGDRSSPRRRRRGRAAARMARGAVVRGTRGGAVRSRVAHPRHRRRGPGHLGRRRHRRRHRVRRGR